jgi:electron transfer flavoprotein beta subunit
MNIVVLVKQVPDTYSERRLREQDGLLDRESGDAVLDEINEKAVEAALQLKEAHDGSTVTVLTVGPERAGDALRKALSMGADRAVHLTDDAVAGADAVTTARVLVTAIGTVDGVDLVLAGNERPTAGVGRCPRSWRTSWAGPRSRTCASSPSRAEQSPHGGRPTTVWST